MESCLRNLKQGDLLVFRNRSNLVFYSWQDEYPGMMLLLSKRDFELFVVINNYNYDYVYNNIAKFHDLDAILRERMIDKIVKYKVS